MRCAETTWVYDLLLSVLRRWVSECPFDILLHFEIAKVHFVIYGLIEFMTFHPDSIYKMLNLFSSSESHNSKWYSPGGSFGSVVSASTFAEKSTVQTLSSTLLRKTHFPGRGTPRKIPRPLYLDGIRIERRVKGMKIECYCPFGRSDAVDIPL